MSKILYLFLIFIILFPQCSNNNSPISQGQFVEIEENYKPECRIMTWKNGKKAAYSVAFDDNRSSHYELAFPEMKKRKIVGTFNLNTRNVDDWSKWTTIAKYGNEIASHTVNHPDLTSLSLSQVEWELKESSRIIEKYSGKQPVSFTNPYGTTNSDVEKLISQYFLSARNQYGINYSYLNADDFYRLKGMGVYPPINIDFLKLKIQETISSHGYLIVYFHSISTLNEMPNNTFMPLSFFQNHLDDVSEHSNDLWIATQGDVIKYMRIRQNSTLQVRSSQAQINCLLKSSLNQKVFDTPITIKLNLPQSWRNKKVVKYFTSFKPFTVFTNVDSVLSINVPINEEIFLKAF